MDTWPTRDEIREALRTSGRAIWELVFHYYPSTSTTTQFASYCVSEEVPEDDSTTRVRLVGPND
jgi:hypothetical protein